MATPKTVQIAEELLPHLVQLAQRRERATYGEAAERIGRHPFNLRYPLHYLRDEILEPRGLPLLTSLLVRSSDGLPGDDLLAGGRDHLDDEAYAALVAQHQQEAFRHFGWNRLLDELGLEPVAYSVDDLDRVGERYREQREEQPPRDEVREQRELLKRFVVENPSAIYVWSERDAETDVTLESGDQVDILFDRDWMGYTLVAVRQGAFGELAAAIQQLDALRAQFRASRDLEAEARVEARIVAYRIPEALEEYAEAHAVQTSAIRPARVEAWASG